MQALSCCRRLTTWACFSFLKSVVCAISSLLLVGIIRMHTISCNFLLQTLTAFTACVLLEVPHWGLLRRHCPSLPRLGFSFKCWGSSHFRVFTCLSFPWIVWLEIFYGNCFFFFCHLWLSFKMNQFFFGDITFLVFLSFFPTPTLFSFLFFFLYRVL